MTFKIFNELRRIIVHASLQSFSILRVVASKLLPSVAFEATNLRTSLNWSFQLFIFHISVSHASPSMRNPFSKCRLFGRFIRLQISSIERLFQFSMKNFRHSTLLIPKLLTMYSSCFWINHFKLRSAVERQISLCVILASQIL